MKIKPFNNNLLLKPLTKIQRSETGLIMPQSKDSDTQKGEVVGIGGGVMLDGIKKGDTVLYARFSGAEIGGMLLIADSDILGLEVK